jgi:hypothetical protein
LDSDVASVVLPIRLRGDEDGRIVGLASVSVLLVVIAESVTHGLDGLPLQPQPDMRIDVCRCVDQSNTLNWTPRTRYDLASVA